MTVRCKVLGRFEVCGAKRGDEVDIDPAKTNLTALVKAGLVEVLPAKPAAKADTDKAAAKPGKE